MNYNTTIGLKIKELRNSKKYTLKYLSEETNLSIGFLSQLERGLTSVAVDSLAKIAKVLDINVLDFFDYPNDSNHSCITRSYDKKYTVIDSEIIQYTLNKDTFTYDMLPRMQDIMPHKCNSSEEIELYSHEGEEFIYVIEGILTLNVDNTITDLYPGDCAHIKSTAPHNWSNNTSKVVKILTVNTPNPLKK